MGLAVSIGFLAQMIIYDEEGEVWIRQELKNINAQLEKEKFATFEEPESLEVTGARAYVSSFPYSYLHYLRRAYAWMKQRPDDSLEPVGEEGIGVYDEMVLDETLMMDSHLLGHSDAQGFYVPVDMHWTIVADGVSGDIVGSSSSLHAELIEVAPSLGITLDESGLLSDEEAARVFACGEDGAFPYTREYVVWLALFELSRLSILHKSMLVFH